MLYAAIMVAVISAHVVFGGRLGGGGGFGGSSSYSAHGFSGSSGGFGAGGFGGRPSSSYGAPSFGGYSGGGYDGGQVRNGTRIVSLLKHCSNHCKVPLDSKYGNEHDKHCRHIANISGAFARTQYPGNNGNFTKTVTTVENVNIVTTWTVVNLVHTTITVRNVTTETVLTLVRRLAILK